MEERPERKDSVGPMLQRIDRRAGVEDLASILAERLRPTERQTLLLEVARRDAAKRRPAEVLADYEANRFVRPAVVSPADLLEWQRIVTATLPAEFEVMALSPLTPLGTCSSVAGVTQDWAVSTIRNAEVVSDPTNVLALEAALRRRELKKKRPKSVEAVHLAAHHRVARPQFFGGGERFFSHFNLLALVSAGRDVGGLRFETDALRLHLEFYVSALRAALGQELAIRIAVTEVGDVARGALLEERLLAPIRSLGVEATFDPDRESGRGYYQQLCFKLFVDLPSGEVVELGDGGPVDWTRTLLSDRKERLVISGLGSERIAQLMGELV